LKPLQDIGKKVAIECRLIRLESAGQRFLPPGEPAFGQAVDSFHIQKLRSAPTITIGALIQSGMI